MRKHMELIDRRIRNKMRVVIWKQWKTSEKRFWGLRKLGALIMISIENNEEIFKILLQG